MLKRDQGAEIRALHVIGATQGGQGAGNLIRQVVAGEGTAVYEEQKGGDLDQFADDRKIFQRIHLAFLLGSLRPMRPINAPASMPKPVTATPIPRDCQWLGLTRYSALSTV